MGASSSPVRGGVRIWSGLDTNDKRERLTELEPVRPPRGDGVTAQAVGIPLPRLSRILPIPHRRSLRFAIGEPISVTNRGSDGDTHAVRSLRREVEGAIHEMLEEELARRAGFTVPAFDRRTRA